MDFLKPHYDTERPFRLPMKDRTELPVMPFTTEAEVLNSIAAGSPASTFERWPARPSRMASTVPAEECEGVPNQVQN
jgi:hypothetical protein